MAAITRTDVHALEELYDRYRVLAYALALRMLRDVAEAEDVVQETFLRVWRSAETYRPGKSSVRSWVLTIVHHRAIDRLRSRQSRPQIAQLEAEVEIQDTADVWRDVSQKLTGESVRAALSHLPQEQRETIELAYFSGYSHSQIAEIMATPVGTVKGRMRIGLQKLKSLLESSQRGLVVD